MTIIIEIDRGWSVGGHMSKQSVNIRLGFVAFTVLFYRFSTFVKVVKMMGAEEAKEQE
jgi:hypothetical protein